MFVIVINFSVNFQFNLHEPLTLLSAIPHPLPFHFLAFIHHGLSCQTPARRNSSLPHDVIRLSLPAGFQARMQPHGGDFEVSGGHYLEMILQRERRVRVFRRDDGMITFVRPRHVNCLPQFGLINTSVTQPNDGVFGRMSGNGQRLAAME